MGDYGPPCSPLGNRIIDTNVSKERAAVSSRVKELVILFDSPRRVIIVLYFARHVSVKKKKLGPLDFFLRWNYPGIYPPSLQ